MDINKMTIEQIEKKLKTAKNKVKTWTKSGVYRIGGNYLIRTVTMIYTGKLKELTDNELVLTNCAWIADTGRWAQACETGNFDEVEPYPKNAEVIIGKGAILDMFEVEFELPTKQK